MLQSSGQQSKLSLSRVFYSHLATRLTTSSTSTPSHSSLYHLSFDAMQPVGLPCYHSVNQTAKMHNVLICIAKRIY
jgi:hypothetical protein